MLNAKGNRLRHKMMTVQLRDEIEKARRKEEFDALHANKSSNGIADTEERASFTSVTLESGSLHKLASHHEEAERSDERSAADQSAAESGSGTKNSISEEGSGLPSTSSPLFDTFWDQIPANMLADFSAVNKVLSYLGCFCFCDTIC